MIQTFLVTFCSLSLRSLSPIESPFHTFCKAIMLHNFRVTITIMVYIVRPWNCSTLLDMFNVWPIQLYTIASYSSGNILAKEVKCFVLRAQLHFPEPFGQKEGKKLFGVKFPIEMKKWKVSLAPCQEFLQISKRWCSGNHELGDLLVWAPRSSHGSSSWGPLPWDLSPGSNTSDPGKYTRILLQCSKSISCCWKTLQANSFHFSFNFTLSLSHL